MRIDGMDASNITKISDLNDGSMVKSNTKDNNIKVTNTKAENINISQMSELEKRELPISEKVVIEAIEKANKAISGANRKFEFSIHEKTKEIMVKVIDAETNEVVREIPPEKILDMVAKMWEMAGIVVDERR